MSLTRVVGLMPRSWATTSSLNRTSRGMVSRIRRRSVGVVVGCYFSSTWEALASHWQTQMSTMCSVKLADLDVDASDPYRDQI